MEIGAFILAAQFPGQGHYEVLDRAVRTADAVERAGLDSVWLAEHHFVPYGTCPSAITLAALLLGRTRRISVGTAVSVLPNTHPVALGEQAALLHLTTGGRFRLGVGRGGPWVDLEVFGGGLESFESGFPESLDLLLRWLRDPRVGSAIPRQRTGADGEDAAAVPGPAAAAPPVPVPGPRRYRFREVAVVPRANDGPSGDGPEVLVACTSPSTAALAARQGLPLLLGMHCGDDEKADMLAHYRAAALAAGRTPPEIDAVGHVSVGVAQVADSGPEARGVLAKAMPEWLRFGLGAHVTVDDRARRMRDPHEYTDLLCRLHPVGTPSQCADRIAATAEATGIRRFAFLTEGSGDQAVTEHNVSRLGLEVAGLLH